MRLPIVLAIARKDIVDAIRNTSLLFTLLLPLGISLLLRVMIPGYTTESTMEIVVYDPGQSRLVEQLREIPGVRVVPVQTADEVPARVEKGAWGGLRLPANFDQAVEAGERPEIALYYNGQRGLNQQVALQRIMEGALRSMVGQDLPAQPVFTDVTGSGKEEKPEMTLGRFYLILFLVMGQTMVGGFVVPTLLAEEKEKHTLQAILVSPAGYIDVVLGKALVGMFYALLVTLLLLFLNGGLAGNIGLVLLSAILGALFLVQLGLLMGALSSSTTQVNVWSSLVMLALLIPAMFSLPPSPPEPVRTLVRLIPTHYTADAIVLSLTGEAALSNVGVDLAVLALSTLVVTGALIWTLRRGRR